MLTSQHFDLIMYYYYSYTYVNKHLIAYIILTKYYVKVA